MIDEKEFKELVKEVGKIKVALVGYDGNPGGLCSKVDKLAQDYYKFKTRTLFIFGVLSGSGVLGVGIWQAIVNL